MKQPRKPTRKEKELITREGLNWNEWSVEAISNSWIIIVHKFQKDKRVIWINK